MTEIVVKLHTIAEDGLPPLNPDGTGTADESVGRVAFIYDGCIVSGWPLWHTSPTGQPFADTWEADQDVGHPGPFEDVTHWVEFPRPIWELVL
jgi:hypothetical protein